jgi:hypothetical protein
LVQILDCSAAHLDGQQVKAAGYDGAIRYLKKEGSSIVVPINSAEAQSLRAAGRSIALVYQSTSRGRVTQGYAAGAHDADWARTQAREADCGNFRAIYFAVDYDAPPSDWPAIVDYASGFGSVLTKASVGVYGKCDLLAYLYGKDVVSWYWQTVAWSKGKRFEPAHLRQEVGYVNVGGVQCDVNECLKPDWGQEGKEDDDMTMTQSQFNEMMNAYMDSQTSPFDGRNLKSAVFQGAQWAGEGFNQAKANGEALTSTEQKLLTAYADNKTQVELDPEGVQQLLAGFGPLTKQAMKDALREGVE